jgi:diguanylate cyclase (GGDEF)-like protein
MSTAEPTLLADDYSRELTARTVWLRFGSLIEAEFRQWHARRVRNRARLWQTLQLLTVLLGGYLLVDTPVWQRHEGILLVALAAHGAVSVVLFAEAFGPAYQRRYLSVAAALTPLRAMAFAATVAAIVRTGGNGAAAITINLFGLFFFSGLMFRQALPAALLMAATFGTAMLLLQVADGLAIYSVSSMLIVLALAGFVAYDTEAGARKAFLEHGLARSDATRDALTRLVNRRHFDAALAELWRRCAAGSKPLTVLLIDIDHFKAYNDRYGHQAGDVVLRQVADALRTGARPEDVVARFGGEEFAVIGTGLDEAAAQAVAERLRHAVDRLAVPHAASATRGTVSISVGGACLVPLPGRSPEGALQLADENLYAAKQMGRNRAVFRTDDYQTMRTGIFRRPEAKGEDK